MSKVNKKNKADKQEYRTSDDGDVLRPPNVKSIRNEEGQYNKKSPCEKLRSPVAILDLGTWVGCGMDAHKEEAKSQVKYTKSEVNTVHGEEAALNTFTLILRESFQLSSCKVCEHDPR